MITYIRFEVFHCPLSSARTLVSEPAGHVANRGEGILIDGQVHALGAIAIVLHGNEICTGLNSNP